MDFTGDADLEPCDERTLHGTAVASVIAADGGADGLGMLGMAPEASIYSYRVCESNDGCYGAWVAAAIHAAIEDGVNIINLSIAGPGHDQVVEAAIDAAVARNILVIAAAGNSPPYSYMGYPTVYPGDDRAGVPIRQMIRITVVDLHGREVARVADRAHFAGWYWADWNGEMDRGRGPAPAGLCFVRLQAEGHHLVRRFALIR